jgi:GntR family transcriptional regulator / MocR family aminotransferase
MAPSRRSCVHHQKKAKLSEPLSRGLGELGCPAGEDGTPPRTWIYRHVLDAIRSGRLAAGERLPSARRLAAAWRVARAAVDDAFAQLQAEGLIERRVGNGSFVAERVRRGALLEAPPPAVPDAATQRALARLASLHVPAAAAPAHPLRLRPNVPDTASFPLAAWRREIARAFDLGDRSGLSYGMPAGVPALRAATARHLSLTRSIDCRPEQVLIVGSPLQAIGLAAQVLLEAGDRVCIDDPGVLAAARGLELAHLRVHGVPLDAEGFDVAHAQQHAADAAALVVQPLNQWPTGVRTSAPRQRELLAWSAARGAWIIELDLQGEIVHDGAAPPALMASATGGRVLYVGSFRAVTFPSLRLAYLVLPEALVDVFAAVRGLMGDHCPVAVQAALATFIDGGHLDAHLRVLRRLYRERRDALRAALARHLAELPLGPMGGGLQACLRLPADEPDTELVRRLQAQRIGARALSPMAWAAGAHNGLVLGYGNDAAEAIEPAVQELALTLGRR